MKGELRATLNGLFALEAGHARQVDEIFLEGKAHVTRKYGVRAAQAPLASAKHPERMGSELMANCLEPLSEELLAICFTFSGNM